MEQLKPNLGQKTYKDRVLQCSTLKQRRYFLDKFGGWTAEVIGAK
jgi:hypothetical protein